MHVKMWLKGNAFENVTKWNAFENVTKWNACENVTKRESMWKSDWKGMHVKMWLKGNACEKSQASPQHSRGHFFMTFLWTFNELEALRIVITNREKTSVKKHKF